jgi:hypothetical protein
MSDYGEGRGGLAWYSTYYTLASGCCAWTGSGTTLRAVVGSSCILEFWGGRGRRS